MSFADNIKAVPITDYAERCGFAVVRKGNKYASLKEHDSVIIDVYKNCYWRNSVFQKGASKNRRGSAGSIIDFAIEFCGFKDAKTAMQDIASKYGITAKTEMPRKHDESEVKSNSAKQGLVLPEKADNVKYVYAYLLNVRKIDVSVVRYFFKNDLLYQDIKNNCVFKTDKFGCIRSTFGKKFVRDLEGCDYNECFFFRSSDGAKTLIVAESVIDVMSIMTLFAREKKNLDNYCYLALAGINKVSSLFYHLENESNIEHIMLAFDNDDAGRMAQQNALVGLNEMGYGGSVEIYTAPSGKDWNEYIVMTASPDKKPIAEWKTDIEQRRKDAPIASSESPSRPKDINNRGK